MAEVTVLISVYNGMPYLPEAVGSILKQTLQDFRLLIINDGSTDGTQEYLNRLSDQRMLVVHRSHSGLGAALNTGLDMCESDLLARMDSDDISLPSRLGAQLSFLNHHRDIGMVGTQIAYLGKGGQSGFSPPLPCEHHSIFHDLLRGRHALCHPTIMCRTSILRKIGGYRTSGIGEDWDMFLRMGEVSRLANLNEVFYLYRLHSGSVSVRHLAQVRMRYAHACQCAQQRAEGRREITFDEFCDEQRTRPFCKRASEIMDLYALAQYRRAVADILNSRCAPGYARLAYAALCSPRWTSQRISRAIRKRIWRIML
jgi:glycosyltransferase involved in cell wall biosynthesis